MKLKFFILFLSVILMTSVCLAQKPDSVKARPSVIKINLSNILTGETFISFEKLFGRHRIEAGAGIIYPFRPWYKRVYNSGFDNTLNENWYSYYKSTGITFKAQYKYILGKHSPVYISPLFMFKYVWYKYNYVVSCNGQNIDVLFSDRKTVIATEILVGAEEFLYKRLFFDFYTGVGVRYFSKTQFSSPDITDFSGDGIHKEGSGLRPSLHFGMSVGLRIN